MQELIQEIESRISKNDELSKTSGVGIQDKATYRIGIQNFYRGKVDAYRDVLKLLYKCQKT